VTYSGGKAFARGGSDAMAEISEGVICPAGPLEAFTARVATAMGADAEVAREVSRHMVRSNLSGHDSHGVILLPAYVSQADRGELVPAARPVVLRETEVAALLDAGRGFGHYSTMHALEWVVARAPRHGVAVAAVRHSSHIGRLGEYTERAAAAGLIGIVTVGAGGPGLGAMLLHGSRTRFFGTNPWSLSVPGETRAMVYDGATSVMAAGKVNVARASRSLLPAGCVVDADGRATRDPDALHAGGALLPLGGATAGHKGSGLAMASALIGALAMIDDPEPTAVGAAPAPAGSDTRGHVGGLFVQAIDPACFGDPARYRALVEEHLAAAKRMPPAAGRDEVLVPGEPEARSRERRGREGIPLAAATWAELGRVAERFGVALPAHREIG
jgi:hydroxycarboxylate dehydrogenase B